MTDLGFGLVDKRSVVIVLFIFALSSIVFGNPIPVDTSNAGNAFIGFVLLTGFIYGARIACRILISIIYMLVRFPLDFFEFYNYINKKTNKSSSVTESDSLFDDEINAARINTKGFRGFLRMLLVSLVDTWGTGWALLFKHIDWGDGKEKLSPHLMKMFNYWKMFGVVDRLCLVLISYSATMPVINIYFKLLGGIGIIVLTIVYTITGRFTFILKDILPTVEN